MQTRWMKKFYPFFLVLILVLTLACNLWPEEFLVNVYKTVVTISEVAVSPPSGPGNFTLKVSYHHETFDPVTVSCYYTGPDKNSVSILVVDDDGKSGFMDITRTKDFSIPGPDGKAEQGVYTATCEDEHLQSIKTATFTVTGEAGGEVSIVEVKVAEGEKYTYALEFAYYIHIPEDVSFTCNYLTPEGATFLIDTYTDTQHLDSLQTKSMFFSIKRADGKVVPGMYTAACQDDEGRSQKSTTFVVVEEATATPEPTNTPQPPVSGKILFDYANAESSRGSAGGELKRVTEQCIPDISFDQNGKISGQCEKLNFKGLLENESVTARVDGTVDKIGNLTFTYEVSEIGNPNGAWRITYTGHGSRYAGGAATGSADFGYNCNSGAENLYWCWKWTSESFSGSIPWRFEPAP